MTRDKRARITLRHKKKSRASDLLDFLAGVLAFISRLAPSRFAFLPLRKIVLLIRV
jgi:hypothetical protein